MFVFLCDWVVKRSDRVFCCIGWHHLFTILAHSRSTPFVFAMSINLNGKAPFRTILQKFFCYIQLEFLQFNLWFFALFNIWKENHPPKAQSVRLTFTCQLHESTNSILKIVCLWFFDFENLQYLIIFLANCHRMRIKWYYFLKTPFLSKIWFLWKKIRKFLKLRKNSKFDIECIRNDIFLGDTISRQNLVFLKKKSKQGGRLAPAYLSPKYKYFDQL